MGAGTAARTAWASSVLTLMIEALKYMAIPFVKDRSLMNLILSSRLSFPTHSASRNVMGIERISCKFGESGVERKRPSVVLRASNHLGSVFFCSSKYFTRASIWVSVSCLNRRGGIVRRCSPLSIAIGAPMGEMILIPSCFRRSGL